MQWFLNACHFSQQKLKRAIRKNLRLLNERRNFQNGVQETPVVAPQVRLLGLAVHVQNSKKYAQDDSYSGQNSRRHDGDRAAVVAVEQQHTANDLFLEEFPNESGSW